MILDENVKIFDPAHTSVHHRALAFFRNKHLKNPGADMNDVDELWTPDDFAKLNEDGGIEVSQIAGNYNASTASGMFLRGDGTLRKIPVQVEKFYQRGTVQLTISAFAFFCFEPYIFEEAWAKVATAPQGGAIEIEVFRNGSSVFDTSGTYQRPTIAAGTQSDLAVVKPSFMNLVRGDELAVHIVHIGDTTPGAHLSFQLALRPVGV